MFNYRLMIAYDGTHYGGWQVQPNAISIQEILQKALEVLLKEPVSIIGSGRTDAGVHALGQVAHFKSNKTIDLHRFLYSLNGLIPKDIRVKHIELAPDFFHSRISAISKEYHYFLYFDPVMDPFRRLYTWHIKQKLNQSLLFDASTYFVGTHDFTSFANQAHRGSAAVDPVRTLYRLDIVEIEQGLRLEFEGNGFLYKMVRNIVGTLIDVALYKRPLADIPCLFEAKDRRQGSQAAPPQGLFLINVKYSV